MCVCVGGGGGGGGEAYPLHFLEQHVTLKKAQHTEINSSCYIRNSRMYLTVAILLDS